MYPQRRRRQLIAPQPDQQNPIGARPRDRMLPYAGQAAQAGGMANSQLNPLRPQPPIPLPGRPDMRRQGPGFGQQPVPGDPRRERPIDNPRPQPIGQPPGQAGGPRDPLKDRVRHPPIKPEIESFLDRVRQEQDPDVKKFLLQQVKTQMEGSTAQTAPPGQATTAPPSTPVSATPGTPEQPGEAPQLPGTPAYQPATPGVRPQTNQALEKLGVTAPGQANNPNPQLGLPNSPEFIGARRQLEDDLAQTLMDIGVQRDEIPRMVALVSARMQTDQGLEHDRINEAMSERGLYDSGVRTQTTYEADIPFERQYGDFLTDTNRQYGDLSRAEMDAKSGHKRALEELILNYSKDLYDRPPSSVYQGKRKIPKNPKAPKRKRKVKK